MRKKSRPQKSRRSEAGPKKDGKTKIVEGAIACFAKKGVAQTTLREIADAADVDQPLIHYYFKSLDELYAEVVQSVRESLAAESIAVFAGEPSPRLQLQKYIEGTLNWGLRHPGMYSIWVHFYYLAAYQPTFAELNATIREVARDRLELIIHRGIEQTLFQPRQALGARQLAFCIHTLLTGALVVGGTGRKTPQLAVDWEHATAMTWKAVLDWLGAES